MGRKTFILDGTLHTNGVSYDAAVDYLRVVEEAGISPKGDAQLTPFDDITKIPKESVILIPPGVATIIQENLSQGVIDAIRSKHLSEGVGYIGGCAGAIFAAGDLYPFPTKLNLPVKFRSGLGFLPADSYAYVHDPLRHKVFLEAAYMGPKYVAKLRYTNDNTDLYCPYLGGPAFQTSYPIPYFVVTDSKSEKYRASAIFATIKASFMYKDIKKRVFLDQPAAVVAKSPKDKRGGMALFSCHPETSIPDSKVMQVLENGKPGFTPFSQDDITKIKDDAPLVLERTTGLLSSLFGGSSSNPEIISGDFIEKISIS
jgi:glutamine amidotransferase-like uncharacterized protein